MTRLTHPADTAESLPLCREADPDLWFPPDGDMGNPAKAMCRLCALRGPCLEFALYAYPRVLGVWGATGPSEREDMRTARGINLPQIRPTQRTEWGGVAS